MGKYVIRTEQEKEEIIRYYRQHGWNATSKKYQVSKASFLHWQERVKTASPTDKHPLARRYLIRPETVALVKKMNKEHPEYSLDEIRVEVSKQQRISRTTVWHILAGR